MNIIRKRTKAEAGKIGGQGSGGHNKGKCCKRATGNYKTRAELIEAAKKYKAQGMKYTDIAIRVGVKGESTVSRLLNGDRSTSTSKAVGHRGENEERGNIQLLNSLWKTRAGRVV